MAKGLQAPVAGQASTVFCHTSLNMTGTPDLVSNTVAEPYAWRVCTRVATRCPPCTRKQAPMDYGDPQAGEGSYDAESVRHP